MNLLDKHSSDLRNPKAREQTISMLYSIKTIYNEKFVSIMILCIKFVECEFCATSVLFK